MTLPKIEKEANLYLQFIMIKIKNVIIWINTIDEL